MGSDTPVILTTSKAESLPAHRYLSVVRILQHGNIYKQILKAPKTNPYKLIFTPEPSGVPKETYWPRAYHRPQKVDQDLIPAQITKFYHRKAKNQKAQSQPKEKLTTVAAAARVRTATLPKGSQKCSKYAILTSCILLTSSDKPS